MKLNIEKGRSRKGPLKGLFRKPLTEIAYFDITESRSGALLQVEFVTVLDRIPIPLGFPRIVPGKKPAAGFFIALVAFSSARSSTSCPWIDSPSFGGSRTEQRTCCLPDRCRFFL
jgi:hypothetical protein